MEFLLIAFATLVLIAGTLISSMLIVGGIWVTILMAIQMFPVPDAIAARIERFISEVAMEDRVFATTCVVAATLHLIYYYVF